MLSFLKRILPERVRTGDPKKTTTPVKSSTVRLLKSEVSRHSIKGTDKIHYSKLDFFVDDQDPVWERIDGYHTCAVDSQIDFEQAKTISKSFTINIRDMDRRENYKSLETMSLMHPLEDAHGSAITWRLHDGSFVTECIKNRNTKTQKSA
jgi:hypothetical protein